MSFYALRDTQCQSKCNAVRLYVGQTSETTRGEHRELNSGPPQAGIIPLDHFAAFWWQLVQYHVISHAAGHMTLSLPDTRASDDQQQQ